MFVHRMSHSRRVPRYAEWSSALPQIDYNHSLSTSSLLLNRLKACETVSSDLNLSAGNLAMR